MTAQSTFNRALTLITMSDPDLSTMTNAQLVALGQALWDIGNRARDLLQPIKQHFQREAFAERNGRPGRVYFDGPDKSRCTVTIPPPHIGGRPRISFTRRCSLKPPYEAPMIPQGGC